MLPYILWTTLITLSITFVLMRLRERVNLPGSYILTGSIICFTFTVLFPVGLRYLKPLTAVVFIVAAGLLAVLVTPRFIGRGREVSLESNTYSPDNQTSGRPVSDSAASAWSLAVSRLKKVDYQEDLPGVDDDGIEMPPVPNPDVDSAIISVSYFTEPEALTQSQPSTVSIIDEDLVPLSEPPVEGIETVAEALPDTTGGTLSLEEAGYESMDKDTTLLEPALDEVAVTVEAGFEETVPIVLPPAEAVEPEVPLTTEAAVEAVATSEPPIEPAAVHVPVAIDMPVDDLSAEPVEAAGADDTADLADLEEYPAKAADDIVETSELRVEPAETPSPVAIDTPVDGLPVEPVEAAGADDTADLADLEEYPAKAADDIVETGEPQVEPAETPSPVAIDTLVDDLPVEPVEAAAAERLGLMPETMQADEPEEDTALRVGESTAPDEHLEGPAVVPLLVVEDDLTDTSTLEEPVDLAPPVATGEDMTEPAPVDEEKPLEPMPERLFDLEDKPESPDETDMFTEPGIERDEEKAGLPPEEAAAADLPETALPVVSAAGFEPGSVLSDETDNYLGREYMVNGKLDPMAAPPIERRPLSDLINEGFDAKEQGRWEDAVNLFKQALETNRHPDLSVLLVLEVTCQYRDHGLYQQAIDFINGFLSLHSGLLDVTGLSKIKNEMFYIESVYGLLKQSGTPDLPSSKIPRLIRLKAEELFLQKKV